MELTQTKAGPQPKSRQGSGYRQQRGQPGRLSTSVTLFSAGIRKASDAAVQANIQRLRMQMAASQPEGAPAPPNPQVDHVAQLQKRLNDNLQWTRMRQDMAEGKQGGWIDPTGEMTKNGMLYPGVSEVASTVVDPRC
jgi:hypothetical protein